jgi:hypothetical protein
LIVRACSTAVVVADGKLTLLHEPPLIWRCRRYVAIPLGSLAAQRLTTGVVVLPRRPTGRRYLNGGVTVGAMPSVTARVVVVVSVSPSASPVIVSG